MPPLGFEPTISAGERPQTYALDRAATGTGQIKNNNVNYEQKQRGNGPIQIGFSLQLPQTRCIIIISISANLKGGHPLVYRQLFNVLVPSIHIIRKDQMYQYNWVLSGDTFRPLTGHPQANKK